MVLFGPQQDEAGVDRVAAGSGFVGVCDPDKDTQVFGRLVDNAPTLAVVPNHNWP